MSSLDRALRLTSHVPARLLALLLITIAPTTARAEGPPPRASNTTEGQWVNLAPQARNHREHAAVYDPVGQRMLVVGGKAGTSGAEEVWELALTGSPVWARLAAAGTAPARRSGHTTIFDPVRYRLLVFGGIPNGSNSRLNDVWELTLAGTPTWSPLAPQGSVPPGISDHAAIYDPIRDRMIVQGGRVGSTDQSSTYVLSLAGTPTWSLLSVGVFGLARSDHSAIYDPMRDRMLVHGGHSNGADLNTTYALDLTSLTPWVQLPSTGSIPQRRAHSAIYDPLLDRMVLFGGFASLAPLGDAWQLDLNTLAWSPIGPTGSAPNPRGEHTAIYDAAATRMIVYGAASTSQAYAFSVAEPLVWSTYGDGTVIPPVERSYHCAIYDPVTAHMLIFFGDTGFSPYIPLGDAWRLSFGATPGWAQLNTPSNALAGAGSVAVFDPQRGQAIITRSSSTRLTLEGSPSWFPQNLSGYSAADQRSSIYDPVRDRVIVFGGHRGSTFTDEVYALSLAGTPTWTQLSTVASPGARSSHVALYDPVRDRMIVFGGVDGNGARSDLWALSLSGTPTWTQLSPGGPSPTGRSHASAYYDSRRDRMVVYGGYTDTYSQELWSLALSGTPQWHLLQPVGVPPSERVGESAVYDPLRDRMILFGGEHQGPSLERFQDSWLLEGDGPVAGPDLRAYPGIEVFGAVAAPVTWNLVVANHGTSPLSVSQITAGDPTISVGAAAPFVLAPGAMRRIPINWSPAASATSATVIVTSDDPDSPSTVVSALRTIAPVARFSASPDSLHVTLRPYESADVSISVSSIGQNLYTFQAWPSGPPTSLPSVAARGAGSDAEAVPGRPSPFKSGGPDAFGYSYDDNREPGGPSSDAWVELGGTAPIGPTANDALSEEIPIGFSFPFYGQNFTHLRACTNGWLSLTNSNLTTGVNTSLPNAGATTPENLLAVFWDALDFNGLQRLRVQRTASRMIVEYFAVSRATGIYAENSFQVQLYPDGTILYLYDSMQATNLNSCTIGIQNGARDDGLQVAFNVPYIAGTPRVSAIRFRAPPVFLSVSPRSGDIPPGESQDLTVHFDSSDLPWGEHLGTVRIRGNDPFEPVRDIPVRLTVLPPLGEVPASTVERLGLSFAGRNPARDGATLELAMPSRAWVEVDVYDVRGRRVHRLERRELESGRHLIRWDGTDGGGNAAGAGIYFVRARAGGEKTDLRIALLR